MGASPHVRLVCLKLAGLVVEHFEPGDGRLYRLFVRWEYSLLKSHVLGWMDVAGVDALSERGGLNHEWVAAPGLVPVVRCEQLASQDPHLSEQVKIVRFHALFDGIDGGNSHVLPQVEVV